MLSNVQTTKGLALHKQIFNHALDTVLDSPFIILAILTVPFFWRLPVLYFQFGKVHFPVNSK